MAKRARGTPRRRAPLRRVRDFAGEAVIDAKGADAALKRLDVDGDGLDMLDRRYLHALVETYSGGPVGVDTLAAALAEARDAIEDVIELYRCSKASSCARRAAASPRRKPTNAWARSRPRRRRTLFEESKGDRRREAADRYQPARWEIRQRPFPVEPPHAGWYGGPRLRQSGSSCTTGGMVTLAGGHVATSGTAMVRASCSMS
ncbi:MAG: Holliday junction DNA helicase RuvB C-terminal domain-containing protein [Hyphomonadaceae bacterium]